MLVRLDRRTGLGLALSAWFVLAIVPAVHASNAMSAPGAAEKTPSVSTPDPAAMPDVTKMSDAQLTRMAAHWDRLPQGQRRLLLREMKLRMARQQGRGGAPMIHAERRFGKLVRRPDGSVVRVETRVIRIRPPQQGTITQRRGTGQQSPSAVSKVKTEVGGLGRGKSRVNKSAQQPRFGVGFERRIILRPRLVPDGGRPLTVDETAGESAKAAP